MPTEVLCPLRAYLDVDLTLTQEQTERLSKLIASHVVSGVTQLRHFFLVEDLVDSLKVPPQISRVSWAPHHSPFCPPPPHGLEGPGCEFV